MAHFILSIWLLVASLSPRSCGQGAPDKESPPTPVTTAASSVFLNNWRFAFSLYMQLVIPNPGRNVLFSPLTFSIPLTLLALQTKPEACKQILQGLGFNLTKIPTDQAHMLYGQFLKALLPPHGACQTDTGSVLFVNHRRDLAPKFVQTARSLFHTEVLLASLENSRTARQQMDSIMREKTHGKIRNLLQDLEPHSALILANYILFKGKWKYHFDTKLTEIRPFSVSEGLTVQVPTMQRLGWFHIQHFSRLRSHVLQLPYACNLTAVLILPDVGRAREAEEAIMEESFETWTQPLPLNSRRRLYFPKLSLHESTQLDELVLPASSLDIFSYDTDLSGISLQTTSMKVSKAVHKVELTMSEDREEKEDITDLRGLPRQLITALHFNRPFLLLIIEESSHNLLFMGKVVNPNAVS